MKILNINSYYYSSTVHKQLINQLKKKGIENITFVPLSKQYVPRAECDYGEDASVSVFRCFNNIDRYFFHIKHKKILDVLVNNFTINDYDIMHAHSLFSNGYIAMKINEKFGLPYVVTVRDTDLNVFFKKMKHLRSIGVKILEKAERIIFLSKAYKETLLKAYIPPNISGKIQEKSVVIPNGVDSFWLNNKNLKTTFDNENILNLCFVGAISKRKNLNRTVEAVKLLENEGYKIKFNIIGKVLDYSVVKNIKKYSFVKLHEPIDKHSLIDFYRSNDIFLMPSRTESFGLVYVEAMSQGLPVIYSRGQGFDKQFENGEIGYSVDNDNTIDIATNIIKIINDYMSISQNCTIKCDKFSWDLISSELIEMYYSVLSG